MLGAAFAIAPPRCSMLPLSHSASAAVVAVRSAGRPVARRRRRLCAQTHALVSPSSSQPSIPSPSPSPSQTPAPSSLPAPRPLCDVHILRSAPVPYDAGWRLQHAVSDRLKRYAAAPDALILLEHEPVYTLGTASSLSHVLFEPPTSATATPATSARRDAEAPRRCGGEKGEPSRWSVTQLRPDAPDKTAARSPCGARLVRTERGGEVTFHGPGQLVVYPILNLHRHRKDLHWYLRALEGVVIDALSAEYGLLASRRDGLTGVWVGDAKVCAIGLKVSKWITMHGLALNVTTDLDPFRRIVPCGIAQQGLCVKALCDLVDGPGATPAECMERARQALLRSFDETFGSYDYVSCTESETMQLAEPKT